MTLDGDGYKNPFGKVFNQSYPGPWIMACWGDDLEITVTNRLKYNGTTIHWHGVRQYNSLYADGVNGVTQCPIAGQPFNDSYTYRFKAMQYGTSWYHSHYALQYADGLLGPLTFFGPSSADYDEALNPTLMTDHLHNSAFSDFYQEITPGIGPPAMVDILLNGTGIYNCTSDEKAKGICEDQTSRYNITVTRGKKYLLRIINTSVDTTFVFAIDNHNLTVIGSDFVSIHPYVTNSIRVGIGQRYHVVVEANPLNDKRPASEQNYWIRTIPATGCFNFGNQVVDNRTGILFYADSNHKTLPTTTQAAFSINCADEPYDKLVPIVPWKVGPPSNQEDPSSFEVGLSIPNETFPNNLPPAGDVTRWELGSQPLWLNFSDPTILHVNQGTRANPTTFQAQLVVVPESVASNAWVYLLISASDLPFDDDLRTFLPVAHPIHLHGHDFVILAQSDTPYWPGLSTLKFDNPPRRDVALLPAGGYILIAFRADNPGSWLIHCHIAFHSSSGLAAQILERDGSIVFPDAEQAETDRICDNWNSWVNDKNNWWDPEGPFQDDSGI
ncbi:putative multicopper oxidase [Phaeomoniella chlamydospora]|uniref:Putative multicopper oxidase n=1 Tax=Phaeomoniella chlamydospora TaxID=158046 RepID=A0A0G2GJ37_PHACM|nr:putative multicopper oxidase [Phaeomoniella chlamydospora]